MAQVTPQQVETIIQRVLAEVGPKRSTPQAASPGAPAALGDGIFRTMDEAVAAAVVAQREWHALGLEKRIEVIEHIRRTMRENAQALALLAYQETGLGRYEDKIEKNLLNANKTPGPEILEPVSWSGDHGLTVTERAPYGVVGCITPTTNPTATIANNTISVLSGGNAAVFNVHPRAKRVCTHHIQLFNRAIRQAGGPANVLTAMAEPTIESAQELMRHRGVRVLLVTGGEAVVKEALRSGKRAVCAGPGNPPVVVDETADLDKAGWGIVKGHSFDNNIVCSDEKEIFCVEGAADRLKAAMKKNGAVEISAWQLKRLEKVIFSELGPPMKPGKINPDWIGQDASKILAQIGVSAGKEARCVLVEVDKEHNLVWTEQMMPVIPLVRVKSADEGIDLAIKAEHNFHHTATMWSRNLEALSRMAREINTSIFVKNGPSLAGLGYGGEGYCSFSIGTTTGEGLTNARTFTFERRCALVDYFRIV